MTLLIKCLMASFNMFFLHFLIWLILFYYWCSFLQELFLRYSGIILLIHIFTKCFFCCMLIKNSFNCSSVWADYYPHLDYSEWIVKTMWDCGRLTLTNWIYHIFYNSSTLRDIAIEVYKEKDRTQGRKTAWHWAPH